MDPSRLWKMREVLSGALRSEGGATGTLRSEGGATLSF